jgi:hypothetical protein
VDSTGRTEARARKETHVNSTTFRTVGRQLLRRANRYTLWAFNPQPELTSRYDRG